MANKTILVVDVETVPNESLREMFLRHNPPPKTMKKEETIEAWLVREMSLSIKYSQVVGLNWMFARSTQKGLKYEGPYSYWDGDVVSRAWWTEGKDRPDSTKLTLSEKSLLWKFWGICCVDSLVGYNIIGFDIPIVMSRSVRLSLKPSRFLGNLKPWEDKVIDIMKRMFPPPQKWMGMKKVRDIYWDWLDIPKEYHEIRDMEGGSVYDLIAKGDVETARLYGKFDAVSEMELWRMGNGFWW